MVSYLLFDDIFAGMLASDHPDPGRALINSLLYKSSTLLTPKDRKFSLLLD